MLVYLVPLFPLLGFLLNGIFRKSLSKSLVGLIGCGAILASFIISCILFFNVRSGGALAVQPLFDFINIPSLKIDFAFQVDQLSALFLLIIRSAPVPTRARDKIPIIRFLKSLRGGCTSVLSAGKFVVLIYLIFV